LAVPRFPAEGDAASKGTIKQKDKNMSRRVSIEVIDDLDGGPADETIEFGLYGRNHSIDLNSEHAAELRALLAPYVAVARRVVTSRRAPARVAPVQDFDPAAVRAWADSRGITVSKRGRVPASLVEQYKAAGN
jgi:hypothetical protein